MESVHKKMTKIKEKFSLTSAMEGKTFESFHHINGGIAMYYHQTNHTHSQSEWEWMKVFEIVLRISNRISMAHQ